jgi:hypothetical protein
MYSLDIMNNNSKILEVKNMPGGDGTGPLGYGPLTGRGLGPCGRGLAFRRGFGRGFGRRRFYYDEPVFEPLTLTKEEQKKILKEEKKELELELQRIQEKLKELK